MADKQANSLQTKYSESVPQISSPIVSDGIDEEFSEELADHADMEAKSRARAADQRNK